MTFLRSDNVRSTRGVVTVGGHLLEVGISGTGRYWELRYGSCLAMLAAEELEPGWLLGGVLVIPAIGDHRPVSWAWGALPPKPATGVEVVFSCGWRRPATTRGHRLSDGLWGAAVPGRAHAAIVVGLPSPGVPAVSDRRAACRLPPQPCAGLSRRHRTVAVKGRGIG